MCVHAIRRTDGGSEAQKVWLCDLVPSAVPKNKNRDLEGMGKRRARCRGEYTNITTTPQPRLKPV